MLAAFCFFGGWLYREFSLEWLLLVLSVWLSFNLQWWLRLKKENGFPSFEVDELGIVVNEAGGVHIFHWEELDSVKRYGSKDNSDDRPGFELSFSDGSKYMVYQRIQGYQEFYRCLQARGIPGTDHRLIMFDRLDKYGKSID